MSPVGVALFAGRQVHAVVGIVVAAFVSDEISADVVARWTAHCRRSAGIALAAVQGTRTVEVIVVAGSGQRLRGSRFRSRRVTVVDSINEVAADVVARAFC